MSEPTIYNEFEYLLKKFEELRNTIKEQYGFSIYRKRGSEVWYNIPIVTKEGKGYLKKPTGEKISFDGLTRVQEKCKKLADFLKLSPTATQIEDFIAGLNSKAFEVVDDRITMEEAVKKVEKWFFQRKDRRKLKRSRNEGSDWDSWDREYGRHYARIPKGAIVTYEVLKEALDAYGIDPETGETNPYLRKYQDCLRAYIKLCEINKLKNIREKLEELKVSKDQWIATSNFTREGLTTEEFYTLRERILNDSNSQFIKDREFWVWVFSVQFVYGLRISEILHIRNWTEDYCPAKDPEENNPLDYVFPALIDTQKNPEHIIYIANYRERPAKDNRRKNAKTGWRYVHPVEDPEHPNMFEDFGIIEGIQKHLPRLMNYSSETLVRSANKNLKEWSKKYLKKILRGTHTLRRTASVIRITTSENDITYEHESGHSKEVAKKNYIERDPEVTKGIEKRTRMAKANRGELKTDIATAMKIITQEYKKLPPHARVFVRNAIMFIHKLYFGIDFDPEKEE